MSGAGRAGAATRPAGSQARGGGHGWLRALVPGAPLLWLGAFFLAPCLVVLRMSFSEAVVAQPPVSPLWRWADGALTLTLHLDTYGTLFGDWLYARALLGSVWIAGVSTAACLLLGYPIALAIARAAPSRRGPLLMAVMLPFWTSFLIRVYAWILILKDEGLLNQALVALGLGRLHVMNTDLAVCIGITYSYLPFMVLPLYATLVAQDPALREAAADLHATPWRVFCSVTLPLSLPGVLAGALLVFIPACGEFVIPDLLGGPDTLMIGKVLWGEFFSNHDWPVASAVAVALLAVLALPAALLQRGRAGGLAAGDVAGEGTE